MKKVTTILGVLLVVLLALVLLGGMPLQQATAQALPGGPLTPISRKLVASNAPTGNIATNNVLITDVGLRYGAALQLNLLALGAGATNSLSALVQNSVDGVVYQTALTLDKAGGGATAGMGISNITASAIRYWRIRTVTSTANGTGTNCNYEIWASTPAGP